MPDSSVQGDLADGRLRALSPRSSHDAFVSNPGHELDLPPTHPPLTTAFALVLVVISDLDEFVDVLAVSRERSAGPLALSEMGGGEIGHD